MQSRRPILVLLKALAAGERWITIHPHGPSEKGQPVLIRQEADGTAKVVGGAGGSLNHLRLRGVRSREEYAQEAAKKAAAHREKRKEQVKADKATGLHQSKQAAREVLRASVGQKHAEYVETIARAVGKDPAELAFREEDHQNLSPTAKAKAEAKHHAAVLKWAKKVEDHTRTRLAEDAEARSASGIGEVPLETARAEQISAADLEPAAGPSKSLGFAPKYAERAQAAGATREDIAAEATAAKPAPKPEAVAARAERREKAKAIGEELKGIRDPVSQLPPAAIVADQQALAVLKAGKALRAAQKEAATKAREIDKAKDVVEAKAYVLEVGNKPVEDGDVLRDIEADTKTIRTRAFLSEVGKIAGGSPTETLGKHIGVGAYNSVNALALAAGGAALVDRSVVDVLGIAGAAQVLARRLHADLTPEELAETREAMGRHHVEHHMAASEEALREARTLQEMAAEITVDPASTGAELEQAQEMNSRRREFTTRAQRIMGVAYGEMEANAALVKALGEKRPEKVAVSMGRTSIEAAIEQARALGLQRGEYRVERAGASTLLSIEAAGLDRLAQPVAREDLEHMRGAMAIINGQHDEEGWLPHGVARRPDLGLDVKPGVVPQLAKPFPENPGDVRQAVRDFIGARAADGETPGDILRALTSEENIRRAGGDRETFFKALDEVAPHQDAKGRQLRAEQHADAFNALADEYAERTLGGKVPALHSQGIEQDRTAADALHRAFAEHPDAPAAFKPVGELSPQDQRALRQAFGAEYAKATNPELAAKVEKLAQLDATEPEREVDDMFGRGENPLWREWRGERDGIAAELNAATPTWSRYVETMGSPARAHEAMQDVVRSRVLRSFADHHNRLRAAEGSAAAPLKVGKAVLRNDIDHLAATNPAEMEKRRAESTKLASSLRQRVGGKYASEGEGAVRDKMAASREEDAAIQQSQMGLFGAMEPPKEPDAPAHAAPELRAGERFSIGHKAERQVAAMAQHIGTNFRPGQKVDLWQSDMSGKYVGRQRAVKLIDHSKRVALGLGTGSGKTSIGLSAFTHLREQGKATRGLFVVPSIAQGQFGAEALTLLEPGRYRWHAEPGATREERLAALKDPKYDFNVVTHQSLRDDLLHLASQREGSTPDAVADKLDKMGDEERAAYLGGVLDAEGIDHSYLAVDEGHQLLNRQGKENSRMANVMDGLGHSRSHYVSMTADPIKNDVSESFDVLRKMNPKRYHDRDAFMRRYGPDTAAAKDGLRREMARHLYSGHIEPDVKARKAEIPVTMGEHEHEALRTLDTAAATARMARARGEADIEALRTLSPRTFEGVPAEQHAELGKRLNRSIGILHDMAQSRAVNGPAKLDALAKEAEARPGKSGVVFAHHLEHVDQIADRLGAAGRRVVKLTGADSSKVKAQKVRDFRDGKYDVVVASDAGAVGANMQKGQWLAQFDTPPTAMVHEQRKGRIHRIGQKQDVELLDLVANHHTERANRARLARKKELRDIVTSPLDGLDETGIAGMLNRVRRGEAETAAPVYAPAIEDEAAATPEPEEQHSLF